MPRWVCKTWDIPFTYILPTMILTTASRKQETVRLWVSTLYRIFQSCSKITIGALQVYPIVPPFPRSVHGKGHIVFAHLRQLHLTFHLLWTKSRIGKGCLADDYDVFFIDQLSTAIPFLRSCAHKRVVFYGHFPDKLLAEGPFIENASRNKKISLKSLYRFPMDFIEDFTTSKSC